MNALIRTFAVLVKELRQLVRDRMTFGMIVGIPLMQMILFGYAINQDVRDLLAGYVDLANTHASRQFIQEVEASQTLRFVGHYSGAGALQDAIDAGAINVGLIIPSDFEQRLADRDRSLGQLLINGSDLVVVSTAMQVSRFPFDVNRGSRVDRSEATLSTRVLYNTEGRSVVFIIPGLIGVILTMTMTLFTAVAIVRERERGNLEFLVTTPVTKLELMIGKILPYAAIGMIQVTLVLALGVFWFDIPFRGQVVDIYLGSMMFILATLTLGLMISTVARSQFQAMQMTMFIFLPSILLSGFMFPFEGMPRAVQLVAEILPLTHFVRIARGVILRGADLHALAGEIMALFAFFVIALALSSRRFSKQLD